MTGDVERERFERWCSAHWGFDQAPPRDGEGRYTGWGPFHAWEAWQAALAARPPVGTGEVERVIQYVKQRDEPANRGRVQECFNVLVAEIERLRAALPPNTGRLSQNHASTEGVKWDGGEWKAGAKVSPKLAYALAFGDTLGAMRKALLASPLYQQGDARLVWVNEGDFLMLSLAGVQVVDLTKPPPPPPSKEG